MNQINDANLVYLEDEDKYILKLKDHTSFALHPLFEVNDSYIENMVDIHDSIFSGTNTTCFSSPIILKGFSDSNSGDHYLECDNNIFVSVNTNLGFVAMMVGEERIYGNDLEFNQRVVGYFLMRAKEINPEYFGGCL